MTADAVLLIAFGGPEKREDIRPFLEIVTAGRRIPAARLDEVAHHYELMGGRSPLNELTARQAEALRQALRRQGRTAAVYVGMRNWHPFLHETLAEMRDRGHRRALGIILSSFQTEASWERYVADVRAARDRVGAGVPEIAFAPPWADHPLFIDAMVARAGDALGEVPASARAAALLLFTAHSVPVAMAKDSPYTRQLETAARAIAARLGHARWQVAYQSRSGSPADPWLEPDIGDVLQGLDAGTTADVVVAPIGFVCDHVEVLYDLDVEARAVAARKGVRFHRAAAANDHPAFVAMLADLVERSGS
ncbi:MAG TPA: ferrochelatase [Candidatus Bathyarchaeia archaeon]|nr:ferrochelatase [Candidatus Bathyarchaeia archaeon]